MTLFKGENLIPLILCYFSRATIIKIQKKQLQIYKYVFIFLFIFHLLAFFSNITLSFAFFLKFHSIVIVKMKNYYFKVERREKLCIHKITIRFIDRILTILFFSVRRCIFQVVKHTLNLQ